MILAMMNIIILVTLFAVDLDTYYQFSPWFDALGIYPYV
jgi:hypothetical protein